MNTVKSIITGITLFALFIYFGASAWFNSALIAVISIVFVWSFANRLLVMHKIIYGEKIYGEIISYDNVVKPDPDSSDSYTNFDLKLLIVTPSGEQKHLVISKHLWKKPVIGTKKRMYIDERNFSKSQIVYDNPALGFGAEIILFLVVGGILASSLLHRTFW